VIPIGDDNRGRRSRPVVVIALILMNLAVFLYELSLQGQGGDALTRFIYAYGAVPLELRHLQDLPPDIPYPVWVTAFTSMFLHGSWIHIGGNMLFLWIFGDNVEDVMGHVKFLIFYLLCGLGAVALQVGVDVSSVQPMIGASGAISGVLAAYLLLFPGGRVRVLVFLGFFVTILALPALIVIGFWIVLQFISGIGTLGPDTATTDGVAYFAHIGGFIVGLLTVFMFSNERARSRVRAMRR
jgi:membrane associated rhomboid family serine protease